MRFAFEARDSTARNELAELREELRMANETAAQTIARLDAISARVDEIDADIGELQLLIQNTTGVPESVTAAIARLATKVASAANRVPEPS